MVAQWLAAVDPTGAPPPRQDDQDGEARRRRQDNAATSPLMLAGLAYAAGIYAPDADDPAQPIPLQPNPGIGLFAYGYNETWAQKRYAPNWLVKGTWSIPTTTTAPLVSTMFTTFPTDPGSALLLWNSQGSQALGVSTYRNAVIATANAANTGPLWLICAAVIPKTTDVWQQYVALKVNYATGSHLLYRFDDQGSGTSDLIATFTSTPATGTQFQLVYTGSNGKASMYIDNVYIDQATATVTRRGYSGAGLETTADSIDQVGAYWNN